MYIYIYIYCRVGWGCRIYRLHLCWGWRAPNSTNACPGYDTKQSDGKFPVMPELTGMWVIPSLPSLPGLLRPVVVARHRVLSMRQIELNCVLMPNWIVWNETVFWHWNCRPMLCWIIWNRTVFFGGGTLKLCTYAKLNCLK